MDISPDYYKNTQSSTEIDEKRPGKGVLYFQDSHEKKSAKGPDFKGFLVLEMDYKAGEKLKIVAWEKPTRNGNSLLSLSEDNFSKKKIESENKTPEPVAHSSELRTQLPHEGPERKIVIESGIEIPKTREVFEYPYTDMKVGDSFTVPKTARAKLLNANYRASKRLGFKFTARAEGDLIRTWRVE